MTTSETLNAIRDAWNDDTAASNTPESGYLKPHGQCAVTALLVQDVFGGVILRAALADDSSHYWNRIPGMGEIDLTRDQYPADHAIPRGIEVPRSRLLEGERALAARTPQRYATLRDRYIEAHNAATRS